MSLTISPPFDKLTPQRVQLVKQYKFVKKNNLWLERLHALIEEISASNDKKKANYSPKNLNLLGHLSFDVLVWEDRIIAFCGVYSGGRYPAGAFRVLNRCYVIPEFRTQKIGEFSNLNSQFLLAQQLEEFSKEIEFPFVSREDLSGYHFLKQWAKKYSPGTSWVVSEDMIHLVPNSTDAAAYQHICYPRHSSHLQLFNKMSPQAWRELYGQ